MSHSQTQHLPSFKLVLPSGHHKAILPNLSYPSRPHSHIWSRSLPPLCFAVNLTFFRIFYLNWPCLYSTLPPLEKFECPFSSNHGLQLRICGQSTVPFFLELVSLTVKFRLLLIPLQRTMGAKTKTTLVSARSHMLSVGYRVWLRWVTISLLVFWCHLSPVVQLLHFHRQAQVVLSKTCQN